MLQREIDELRTRESSATRKQELESQGVRLLELRLKESLSLIDAREADIARRERLMEDNRTAAVAEARKEAHAKVAAEMEMLTRERAALLMEKALFNDTQASQAAIVESCKSVRDQLRVCQEEVVCREEEVGALQRQLQRMALQREEEAGQIRKVTPLFIRTSQCNFLTVFSVCMRVGNAVMRLFVMDVYHPTVQCLIDLKQILLTLLFHTVDGGAGGPFFRFFEHGGTGYCSGPAKRGPAGAPVILQGGGPAAAATV